MKQDAKILRPLAVKYAAICGSDQNAENRKLHRAVNDLQPIRPVVLIDEIPWHEMNIDDELTLRCEDSSLRRVEWFLRTALYKHKHMPADMVLPAYVPVQKVIHVSSIGISVSEEILATNQTNPIVSHKYQDQLRTEEDLNRLVNPVVTYDRQTTERQYQLVGDVIGDLVPVKKTGIPYFTVSTWDDIARFRGVTNLLIDLAERPQFMHAVVRRLTDMRISYLEQVETLGLFDNAPDTLHCTPLLASDLPSPDYDGGNLRRQDVWGRGAAQIFASVSKSMHEEFDIAYMQETIGQCGLAYYGCCEPLDTKMDIVSKIPNLRKVSVTPWADVSRAAEAIGTQYVLSAKPNPAAVAVPLLDKEALRREIGGILEGCRRNHCACDIVLKDISTCGHRPENLFVWEQTVMEMVRNH